MNNTFRKATKQQAKLRCAVFGPSGAGKTFTALRIAKGMGGTIGLIDTEHASASKYADRFDFITCNLDDKSIPSYIDMIKVAAENKIDVLIIDSMSHGWQELLQEIDKLAKAKYHGNTWGAWSEGTPKQKMLVEAILSYPGHVIATMRSKTECATEKTDNGKTKPTRVGLTPEQGKGIEYEFDLLIELSTEHIGNVLKDRTGKFQDKLISKPDEKFGKKLIEWLNDGEVPEVTWIDTCQADADLATAVKELKLKKSECQKIWDDTEGDDKAVPFRKSIMDLIEADIKANTLPEPTPPADVEPPAEEPDGPALPETPASVTWITVCQADGVLAEMVKKLSLKKSECAKLWATAKTAEKFKAAVMGLYAENDPADDNTTFEND